MNHTVHLGVNEDGTWTLCGVAADPAHVVHFSHRDDALRLAPSFNLNVCTLCLETKVIAL